MQIEVIRQTKVNVMIDDNDELKCSEKCPYFSKMGDNSHWCYLYYQGWNGGLHVLFDMKRSDGCIKGRELYISLNKVI